MPMRWQPPRRPGIGQVSIQQICEKLTQLAMAADAKETDLIFLRGVMDGPGITSLVKCHDKLEDKYLAKPLASGACELVDHVSELLADKIPEKPEAKELNTLLQDPHMLALLESHDIVADHDYDSVDVDIINDSFASSVSISQRSVENGPDAIRIVGVRKVPGEPLGITVKVEKGDLVIARILAGGVIDRQGLLSVGDIVKEVNGVVVRTPEQMQEHMKKAVGSVNLKVIPSYMGQNSSQYVYMKAHFDYDPGKDSLIPSKEAGLSFKSGNILQIVNMDDPNWWQARVMGSKRPAGIVPSQSLEERRKAYVRPEDDFSTSFMCGALTAKRKRKILYHSNKSSEFDRHDLLIYEEVARMPPFQRKTLVLIGAQGVGRRSLKSRLLQYDPTRFGTTIPHTSRDRRDYEEDGQDYFFITRQSMEADVAANRYLEHGEYGGNLYGTKLDSVRAVIRAGKMCVLDCNPQALKSLNTSEFMPYVVFVQSPSLDELRGMHQDTLDRQMEAKTRTYDRALKQRTATMSTITSEYNVSERDMRRTVDESARLKRTYERYFDLVLTNDNFEATFQSLVEAVNSLSTEPQWVPVTWVY